MSPDVAPAGPADALEQRAREAHALLESTTREFPYASVAAALGTGFVLGGGMPSWAVRLLLTSGARLVAARWVDAVAQSPEVQPALRVAQAPAD